MSSSEKSEQNPENLSDLNLTIHEAVFRYLVATIIFWDLVLIWEDSWSLKRFQDLLQNGAD